VLCVACLILIAAPGRLSHLGFGCEPVEPCERDCNRKLGIQRLLFHTAHWRLPVTHPRFYEAYDPSINVPGNMIGIEKTASDVFAHVQVQLTSSPRNGKDVNIRRPHQFLELSLSIRHSASINACLQHCRDRLVAAADASWLTAM
jgi:hypothetical protein